MRVVAVSCLFVLWSLMSSTASAYNGLCASAEDVAALPERHWCRVPNSNLEDVEKQPNEYPDWNGSSSAQYESFQRVVGIRSVVQAWNSGAYDSARGQYLVFGGGHNDYGGNEIYSFSLQTLSWKRLTDPTPYPSRHPSFQNNDGTPVSRHTYNGVQYVSHLGQFFVFDGAPDHGPGTCGVRGTWTFDLEARANQGFYSTDQWDLRTSDGEPARGCDNATAYDPVNELVYFLGANGWWSFDFNTNQWSERNGASIRNSGVALAVDPENREIVQVGGGYFGVRSLDSGSLAGGQTTYLGPGNVVSADDPGLVYDSSVDRIVAWRGGTTVYALDVANRTWSAVNSASSNVTDPGSVSAAGGVFGRWQYSPEYNVYMIVDATNKDVYLYRLSTGTGIGPVDEPVEVEPPPSPDVPPPVGDVEPPGSDPDPDPSPDPDEPPKPVPPILFANADATDTTLAFAVTEPNANASTQAFEGSLFQVDFGVNLENGGAPDARIVSKSIGVAEQDHDFMVSLIEGQFLRFRLKLNGTTHTLVGSTPVPRNEYIQGRARYDGQAMTLWLNGNLDGTLQVSGTVTPSSKAIAVGVNPDGHGPLPFSGTLNVLISANVSNADLEAPPTIEFGSSTDRVDLGDTVTLTWTAQNADSCQASDAWTGQKATSGSEVSAQLNQNADFTLTCEGAGGVATRTVSVSVDDGLSPPSISISAQPTTVSSGESTTLTWNVTGAESCAAGDAWSGAKAVSGSEGTGGLASSSTFSLTCQGPGGSSTGAVFVSVTGAEGPFVTTIDVIDSAASGNRQDRAFTIGLPLPEGVLLNNESLVVKRNGTTLPSQWNPLASWRTDGSQLHGALTFALADATDASGTYTIEQGTPAGGAIITTSDIIDSGFDATIQVATGGNNYSLSAADLLSGDVVPRQEYTHFSGALASEYVVGGALRINGNGAEHSTLQGYFHIRAFSRPVSRVYVTMVLENTGVFRSLSDISGDVTLRVGNEVAYTNSGFSIHADKRYPKRFWWSGDPELWVRHDVEYVQDTKLVPEYREVVIDEGTLAAYPQSLDWHGRGQLNAAMNGGGSQRHIAPLDSWSAAYLISGDRRAFNAMRAHDDAYHWVASNVDFAMHTRDENTGFPVDLAQNTGLVGHSWGGMAAFRRSTSPLQNDMAHEPSNGYLAYLLTAEYDALESSQLWGVSAWLRERPGSFAGWPRSFIFGETRAVGWGLRNVVNAAVITPDQHPLKNTLDDGAVFALASLNNDGRSRDANDSTGILLTGPGVGQGIHEPNSAGQRTGMKPWMQDYVTWAIGAAYEKGYRIEMDQTGLWTWASQAIVDRLGDGSEFCWAYGAQYTFYVMDSEDGPTYPDWATIMDRNIGSVDCPAPGTTDVGTDRDATDYGAQMAPAAAVAADTGRAGAAEAWQRYDSRAVEWTGFETRPEWAIKRRD